MAEKCSSHNDIKNALLKLTRESYFFTNIDYKLILDFLRDGILKIIKMKPGQTIFQEGNHDSSFFYLLLKGEVSILVNGIQLCTIDKISLIGEVSFINPDIPRSATVVSTTETYCIQFDQCFFDKIPYNIQSMIYRNIAKEMALRFAKSNQIIAGKLNCSTHENAGTIITDSTINEVVTLLGDK